MTSWDVLTGDCRDLLAQMPADSVHTVVTSPPYYSLRDYGADGQIGLEATVDQYVSDLCDVFDATRRVMRDDATLWLNLGDSYGPQKQLQGIPWRVAFALQARGWCLRSDIIWAKLQPNPMPESVTDRPTRSHEFIFLLSKNSRYFYDADSIREGWTDERNGASGATVSKYADPSAFRQDGGVTSVPQVSGRNRRDVWTVSTKPFSEAHFATFPPDLIEPCVLAGCPERACSACGAPWERIVERTPMVIRPSERAGMQGDGVNDRRTATSGTMTEPATSRTIGLEPSCSCNVDPAPGTVLDPFAGAGTTGLVAVRNRRAFIGLELNPEYAQMARDRIATDIRLGHRAPQRVDVSADQIDIFEALS